VTDYTDAIVEAQRLLRQRARVTLGNRRNGKGAETSSALPPASIRVQPVYRILASIAPETVLWLDPGRIPLGKITILEGDPGLGKSTLLAELTARVTRGEGFPGSPLFTPAWVVWLSGEDGAADTLRPRLDAAGADVERVAVLDGVRVEEGPERELVLPEAEALRALEELLTTYPVKLVIIDVLNAFLSSEVDAHKDHHIRRALRPLKELAERTGVAIAAVRHLTKASGGKAIMAGGGSIGLGGAARSLLLVDRDPQDPTRCVLASVKSNCSATPPSLSFAIVGAPNGAAMVEWHGTSSETAESLTAARTGSEDSSPREVEDYLRELLEGDGLDRGLVMKRTKEAGYGQRSVQRAAHRLGVVYHKPGFGLPTVWRLPILATGPIAPSAPLSRAGVIGAVGAVGELGDAWEAP
jgi:hypothetical protein